MLSSHYKGRTTIGELMQMSLSDINTLYDIALKRQKAKEEEEKAKKANGEQTSLDPEAFEEMIEEMEGM